MKNMMTGKKSLNYLPNIIMNGTTLKNTLMVVNTMNKVKKKNIKTLNSLVNIQDTII